MLLSMRHVKLGELHSTCKYRKQVFRGRKWVLLDMRVSVHRNFVVTTNAHCAIGLQDRNNRRAHWEYGTGSVMLALSSRSSSSSTFFFIKYGTVLALQNTGVAFGFTWMDAFASFTVPMSSPNSSGNQAKGSIGPFTLWSLCTSLQSNRSFPTQSRP